MDSDVFRLCERGTKRSGGQKSPSGFQGQSLGRGSKTEVFVNECLDLDLPKLKLKYFLAGKKISKTAKISSQKNYGRLKGGRGRCKPPPNMPKRVEPSALYNPSFSFTQYL